MRLIFLVGFLLSIGFVSGQECDILMANSGLELNNFDSWKGKRGVVSCFPKQRVRSTSIGFYSLNHRIVSLGQDCDVPKINTVYEGMYGLMLGGKGVGNNEKASYATYTFEVNNDNKEFYFHYSLILQNPNHTSECNNPYFKYRIFTSSKNIKKEKIIADSSNPFFETAVGECDARPLVYSNWTCERTDLSEYVGECVSIEFLVADCTDGGHWAVAYIDGLGVDPEPNLVSEFDFSGSDIGYCLGESIVIDGAASENEASYFISIEESDPNMGRPNPSSELSKWFVGEEVSYMDISNLYEDLGGTWKCNTYYRVKLAVSSSCGGWVEKTKLLKISCPEVSAGLDICCEEDVSVGSVGNSTSYSYSWSPETGLADKNNQFTVVDCKSGQISDFDSFQFKLTATDEFGCTDVDQVTIFNVKPGITLESEKVECCKFRIVAQVYDAISFEWSNGITDSKSILVDEPGVYSIKASNPCGSTKEFITIDEVSSIEYRENIIFNQNQQDFQYYISRKSMSEPNFFQVTHVVNPQPTVGFYYATSYKMDIYNRWGDKIHSIEKHTQNCIGFENNSIVWDGSIAGQPVQSGAYTGKLYFKNCIHTEEWVPVKVTHCSKTEIECLESDCLFEPWVFDCGFWKKEFCLEWITHCVEESNDYAFPMVIL